MNIPRIWQFAQAVCLVLLALSITTPAQEQDTEPTQDKIRFANVYVKSALSVLGKNLKMEVVYDQSVKNEMVEIELEKVTVSKAMTVIFEKHKLRACLIEEKTILVFPDTEENRKKNEQYKPWPAKREPEK